MSRGRLWLQADPAERANTIRAFFNLMLPIASSFLQSEEAKSERVPQRKLQDPWIASRPFSCLEDLAERGVGYRVIRAPEVGVVEQVEGFRPEVDTLCLREMAEFERERLAEREIKRRNARAP